MKVYLDYNATAPIREETRRAMEPLLFGAIEAGAFGNASSIHWAGREARKHLERARTKIAELVQRKPSEIVFTSGATEADNLALRGILAKSSARRLIISAVEHPAVIETAAFLEREGVEVDRVAVDAEGRLDLAALDRALSRPAALISIMAVNNETGVISPIEEVLDRAKKAGVLTHVDAVQAAGRIPLPLDADLISLSAHKVGGPKGIGALITRATLPIEPLLFGGPQERGHRGGTEAVPLAAGFAAALEKALADRDQENTRLAAIRERIDRGLAAIEGVRVLGANARRVANTTTALFSGVEAETLLHALDLEGVAASSGSACASGSLEPSHVLLAMGVPKNEALSAVRFSLGWASRIDDANRLIEVLPPLVRRARGG